MSTLVASRSIIDGVPSPVSLRRVYGDLWPQVIALAERGVRRYGGEVLRRLPNGDTHVAIGGRYPDAYVIVRPLISLPNSGRCSWAREAAERITNPAETRSWAPCEVVGSFWRPGNEYFVRWAALHQGNIANSDGITAFELKDAIAFRDAINKAHGWA